MADAPIPSKDALLKQLESVKAECLKLAGDPTINPFLYVRDTVDPVVAKVKAATTVTKELAAEVMAVKACIAVKPVVEEKK